MAGTQVHKAGPVHLDGLESASARCGTGTARRETLEADPKLLSRPGN
jgi:hypothetical protein